MPDGEIKEGYFKENIFQSGEQVQESKSSLMLPEISKTNLPQTNVVQPPNPLAVNKKPTLPSLPLPRSIVSQDMPRLKSESNPRQKLSSPKDS